MEWAYIYPDSSFAPLWPLFNSLTSTTVSFKFFILKVSILNWKFQTCEILKTFSKICEITFQICHLHWHLSHYKHYISEKLSSIKKKLCLILLKILKHTSVISIDHLGYEFTSRASEKIKHFKPGYHRWRAANSKTNKSSVLETVKSFEITH